MTNLYLSTADNQGYGVGVECHCYRNSESRSSRIVDTE